VAKLVIREGARVGKEYVFPPRATSVMLGRAAESDLQVLDAQSSRRHAEIEVNGSRFTLRDLGSSNGTHINGRKVDSPAELRYGDRIRIGGTEIELVDDSADEGPPPEIPGHRILEKIGSGGMGTVYRAQQLSMDRVVALKILNERHSRDRAFIERFVREARAAGRLGHPNVIHVNDVGEAGGVHYFSMEYVDGTTVKRLLKEDGRLDLDKALDIVVQTARALKYAHDNGIVHRDVKPDNIMLTKEGIVKIADLGIAKTFDDSSSDASSKRIFGTPHYMSPEQALGKEIDARADIYSLGATFYHVLTGSTPFSGRTVMEVLKAHIEGNLPPVKGKAPDVPDSVVFIIERMMARRREKRYPTTAALIEDLERVQHDREVEIERLPDGESSIIPSAKRVSGRKPEGHGPRESAWRAHVLVALFFASTLGLGPLGVFLAWLLTNRTSSRKRAMVVGGVVSTTVVCLIGLFLLTVFVARGLGGVEGPDALFERASELRSEGRDSEAREEFRKLIVMYPASPQASLARAVLGERDGSGTHDVPPRDGDTGPVPGARPEDALERAEKLETEGDLERALEETRNCMAAFAADAAFVEKAKVVEKRLQAAMAEKNELAAREALARVDEFAAADPEDVEGLISQLEAVAETFAGTSTAKEAEARAKRLARKLAADRAEKARRDYERAQEGASAARARGDYDAAIAAYRAFAEAHPDSTREADAREAARALEDDVKTAFEKALAESNRSLAASRYKLARASLERFQKNYRSTKWNSEARQKIAVLDQAVRTAFDDEHEKVKPSLAAFNYDDAGIRYRLLASRFGGTPWAKYVEGRLKEIEAERDIHRELIRKINVICPTSPRSLPFPAPKVPENMAGLEWRVLKASQADVTLGAGPGNRTLRAARWEDFPAGHLLDLFEMFFPDPTREQHLALAYLCQERGLEARAREHLAAAAGE
jgi:serine/threonine-protein kinase